MRAMRVFTAEQANRTLPLVSRIVHDIVTRHADWAERVRDFDVLQASVAASVPSARSEALQGEISALAREIEGYVRELEELGIVFRVFDMGLVDFPSEMDGRPVFLCWRLGEQAVAHWHEVDEGYAGRHPLPRRVPAAAAH